MKFAISLHLCLLRFRKGTASSWPGSTTPSSARITWYAPQSVANLLLFRIFDRFMVFYAELAYSIWLIVASRAVSLKFSTRCFKSVGNSSFRCCRFDPFFSFWILKFVCCTHWFMCSPTLHRPTCTSTTACTATGSTVTDRLLKKVLRAPRTNDKPKIKVWHYQISVRSYIQ
jgi:hypothetical protein